MYNQLLSGHVEPGASSYLLFRYGRIGNRLLLVNMPTTRETRGGVAREGEGFTPQQLREIGPLSLATSRDFHRLDDQRLDRWLGRRNSVLIGGSIMVAAVYWFVYLRPKPV